VQRTRAEANDTAFGGGREEIISDSPLGEESAAVARLSDAPSRPQRRPSIGGVYLARRDNGMFTEFGGFDGNIGNHAL